MEIHNLIIETTRRCNFKCKHCLRGDAQNKNISYFVMEKFLLANDIKYIGNITFTGGEPLLNIKAINDFILICEHFNISVGSFYIATNGSQFSMEIVQTLMRLWLFCDDNEISMVHISNTDYHNSFNSSKDSANKLKLLKFVTDRDKLDNKYVIAEGRGVEIAELNGTIDNARIIKQTIPKDEEKLNEGDVYLNVKGDVLTECDFSYKNQDKHKLFNCEETTFKEWFQR